MARIRVDAALQCEDRRLAQPVRVPARHVDLDARTPQFIEREAFHPADRKTREREIHADAHALAVVGDEREVLVVLEHAARRERIEDESGA